MPQLFFFFYMPLAEFVSQASQLQMGQNIELGDGKTSQAIKFTFFCWL